MASPAKRTTNEEDEMTVLSSVCVCVQSTYYNLGGITPKIKDLTNRPSTSKSSPAGQWQRARKTFPSAKHTAFKIPAAVAGSSSRQAPRELPAPDSPATHNTTLSEMSTVLEEAIGSPSSTTSTPAPPVIREEDFVSTSVRPVESSPSITESESDPSDADYQPSSIFIFNQILN